MGIGTIDGIEKSVHVDEFLHEILISVQGHDGQSLFIITFVSTVVIIVHSGCRVSVVTDTMVFVAASEKSIGDKGGGRSVRTINVF